MPRDRVGSGARRVPLIRHAALCAGALIACVLREDLKLRDTLLWIIVGAAILNLLVSIGWKRRRTGRVARRLSTLLGIAGWSLLAMLTGGVTSPFIAGLWLEIVLSASAPPAAILATTGGAVAGLWSQSFRQGIAGLAAEFSVLTAFLVVSGLLTLRLARRWRRSNDRLTRRMAGLRLRLGHLEQELRAHRGSVGGAGEERHLAHSLKNAVHSMRGFVLLLEPRLQPSAGRDDLVAGLRAAIDHLEELSRAVLSSRAGPERAAAGADLAGTTTIREAVDQVAAAFPAVRWSVRGPETPAGAAAPAALVRDALINVLRNAAEAMSGRGEVQVTSAAVEGRLVIQVRDHGPGMSWRGGGADLEPGRTTKIGGHGLGLALTRRLLEGAGGRLTLSPAEGGGVVCAVELPRRGSPPSLADAAGST